MAFKTLLICLLLAAALCTVAGLPGCNTDSGTANSDSADSPHSPAKQPDLVFRFALQPDPANKVWDAARLVKENLERRSNGRIKIMFYSSGVLGNEQQLLETCYLGVIEMVQCTSSVVTTLDATFDTLDMPYIFVDEPHHLRVLNGPVGQELCDGLNKNKLQGLAFYSCGFRNIYASKAVTSPQDFTGMKIRVMESPVMIEAINLMGASATPLSSSEVFTALKTGVVDGAENNPNVFVSAAHIEAVKHYSLTRHFANQHVLIANKAWLDKVKRDHPDLHQLIIDVPRDIITQYNQIWRAAEEKAYSDIKQQNGYVHDVPRESILTFMKQVDPLYESKKDSVPPELVKRIRQEAGL